MTRGQIEEIASIGVGLVIIIGLTFCRHYLRKKAREREESINQKLQKLDDLSNKHIRNSSRNTTGRR
jgi:hypothetical protein